MKKYFIRSIHGIFSLIFLSLTTHTLQVHYDENHNVIEIRQVIHSDETMVPSVAPSRNVLIFTPDAPYDGATFIINTPTRVQVGQEFTIDYAIRVNKFTNIPFWSDLIPDDQQRSASDFTFIRSSKPNSGVFTDSQPSIALKGGKGLWSFVRGIPSAQVSHLKVTLQANSCGTKYYSTCLATNPPLFFGPVEITTIDDKPIANPDNVRGYQNEPIIIGVLENDISASPLKIISVTQPVYGTVNINEDNTLTYYPNFGYAGNDSMTYTVQDEAGNTATGLVKVCVLESLKPSILF